MLNDFQLTCEVCGRVRPHQELHVKTREGTILGVGFKHSVTHCYDDTDCIDHAVAKAEQFIQKFKVTL